MNPRRISLVLLAAAALTGPAAADEITQVMNLWGATLAFPPPSWVQTAADAANPEKTAINRQENQNTFLFELVPKEEGFERWTTLYGVVARVGPQFSVTSFEQEVLGSYGNGCADVKGEAIPGKGFGSFFVLYCGHFADNPRAGQIGVFRIVQTGPVTARVYQEWRGAAFKPGAKEGLPVAAATLEEMVKRLETVALHPPQN